MFSFILYCLLKTTTIGTHVIIIITMLCTLSQVNGKVTLEERCYNKGSLLSIFILSATLASTLLATYIFYI